MKFNKIPIFNVDMTNTEDMPLQNEHIFCYFRLWELVGCDFSHMIRRNSQLVLFLICSENRKVVILFAPAVTDMLPVLELHLSVQPLSVDIICCWKNNIYYSVLVSEPLKTEVLIKLICLWCVHMCALWSAKTLHMSTSLIFSTIYSS